MFGNANDPVKGRQMPDHYTAREAHFGSISSPVGTQITQAVGFAWAAKIKREDPVAIVYFGDGATSSNDFHNGMNFAGVFKTPIVFFCRNNGWAISVPTERQTASATFAEKGIAYGVPGVRVRRQRPSRGHLGHERRARARGARRRADPHRSHHLPAGGHSTSDDPKAYRDEDEVEHWRRRDPMRGCAATRGARLWSDADRRRA